MNEEISVGLSVALTGRYARQGQQALDGIRLWQSYIKDAGGIAVGGRRLALRLLHYNDHSRISRTRQNILRLLDFDKVDILLGPYSSVLTVAAAEEANRGGRLLWNTGGAADEISNFQVVSCLSPASDYFRQLPDFLAKCCPSLRRVCIAERARGTFAFQVARGLREAVAELGVHSVDGLPFTAPVDERAFLRKLTELQPEVVVLAGAYEDELALLRSRLEWPSSVKIVAAVAAGLNAFGEDLQSLSEGVIGPSQWEPDAHFEGVRGPDSRWFTESFQLRFGIFPEYIAASAFGIGVIVGECLQNCGVLDDVALRDSAAGLEITTLFGKFRIDAKGRQIGHRMLLVQWQQGKKQIL